MRSSAVLLKKKRERQFYYPTARASVYGELYENNSLLKNRTVSWCLPGNLGRLFDFLIRSSQPDRSRRSREVSRPHQSCSIEKKEGERQRVNARAPLRKFRFFYWLIPTRGQPTRTVFLSAASWTVKHENAERVRR